MEESLNSSEILCELSKQAKLFEFLSKNETLDLLSIGLEQQNEHTVRSTLKLLNTILSEYSRDGSNKRIKISNFSDDEENLSGSMNSNKSNSLEKSVEEDDEKFLLKKSLTTLMPLVQNFIKEEEDKEATLETVSGTSVRKFGLMRMEAVEFFRLVIHKFGK